MSSALKEMNLITFGRRLAACLASLICAGCVNVHLVQNPGDMITRVGSTDVTHSAPPFAEIFLEYALLADQTYDDLVYETRTVDLKDKTYCYPEGEPNCVDQTGKARSILSRWRIIYASKNPSDFPCASGRLLCAEPIGGLGVQIWVRRGGRCSEAVIAFRGTDRTSSEDWLSNLHWLVRLLPLYDQYEQVQDYTPDFVKAVAREPCFQKGKTQIAAVGHSLGGGLAQQAAYMDRNIRHVYAFDPSIVTGSTDRDVREHLEKNVPGLKIERIYEHGEILAYLRFLQRHLMPPTSCNPQIRSVRFHSSHGTAADKHKLKVLTTTLLHWSRTTPPSAKRSELPKPQPGDCSASQGLLDQQGL